MSVLVRQYGCTAGDIERSEMSPSYSEIRSTHPHAFRSGEWGQITGIFKYDGRDCFRIQWSQREPRPDIETIDYWPVDDPSDTGRELR